MDKGLAFHTGSSVVVKECQVCTNKDLEPILFLGYLPPVNQFREIGTIPPTTKFVGILATIL